MKKFLVKITLFSAIIMCYAFCADYIISKGLSRTQRGHFFTMNAIMNDTLNADIIILGNSRAGGYDPRILDSILNVNTWNLGVSGQHFCVEYLRYQLYKRKNIKPKLILLNIGMGELGFVDGYEREQYYPYIHEPLIEPYLEPYSYNWLDINLPMYRYRGDHKLIFIGIGEYLGIIHDTKGSYVKGYSTENNDKWNRTAFEKVKKSGIIREKANPIAVNLLDSFIFETRKQGVPIVFCHAPMYYELRDWLDLNEVMEVYQSRAAQYCIPLLDYTNMELCNDSTSFKDTNHMNAKGAKIFTTQLAHDLDSLGIISH